MQLREKMLTGNMKALAVGLLLAALMTSSLLAKPAEAAETGRVSAWGLGTSGQLGNGGYASKQTPVSSNLSDVKSIAGGVEFSVALKSDGTVWAWGDNLDGQLGNGTNTLTATPVQVKDPNDATGYLTNVKAIAAGSHHSLALKSDGTVRAWGMNNQGQLGDGNSNNSNTPVKVQNLTGVKDISGGGFHSLALKTDGTVRAWGDNSSGQLGNGTNNDSNTPVQVSNLSGIMAIATGGSHSLALTNFGLVRAWGYNEFGQLGNGSSGIGVESNTPVAVKNLNMVKAIAAGTDHSLALKTDGTVRAWGSNSYNQLGNGNGGPGTISNTPVSVSNLSGVKTISAGSTHSLALKTDGAARAWGYNFYGQLGTGNNTSSATPVAVKSSSGSNLTGVQSIAAGGMHSLAIRQ